MISKIFNNLRKIVNKKNNSEVDKNVIIDSLDKINDENISKTIVSQNTTNYELPNADLIGDNILKELTILTNGSDEIPIMLGKSTSGIIIEKLNDMPNMLIGGTVMSGKTSFVNTIISSILLIKKPNELKMVLFDSKKVDYSIYNGLPHLLCQVLCDSKKLEITLYKICSEIEYRLKLLNQTGNKTILNYNKNVESSSRLPSIVVIIDDITTLNMSDSINDSIEFITSNGWNVNIYVIVVANHPSSKVISTISKSNFPSRLSFKVASNQASQIIVNQPGAEKLKGFGETLYVSRFTDGVIKVEVPTISDELIEKIVNSCKNNQWVNEYKLYKQNFDNSEANNFEDPLYKDIVEFVVKTGKVSASLLQRKYKFGYNRAARIIDLLEERGIIGPQNGSKPREVLVKLEEDDEFF